MKKISALAGVCAVAAGLALTGCSAKTETTATTTTETTAATSTTTSAAPATAKKTIADYVAENKIIETAIKQGDPGPPSFQFPMPPGWRPAGNQRPEWAYGAIVYEKAEDPADPPFMTAIISRLSGNVEAAKIFEYAPGLLQNLPGYEQDGEIQKSTLGGFEAIQFQGSYQREHPPVHRPENGGDPGEGRLAGRPATQRRRAAGPGRCDPRGGEGDRRGDEDHRLRLYANAVSRLPAAPAG